MIFYPIGSGEGLDAKKIENINIKNIIENENPFCIDNIKGKVKITLKMNFGEDLVVITN